MRVCVCVYVCECKCVCGVCGVCAALNGNSIEIKYATAIELPNETVATPPRLLNAPCSSGELL